MIRYKFLNFVFHVQAAFASPNCAYFWWTLYAFHTSINYGGGKCIEFIRPSSTNCHLVLLGVAVALEHIPAVIERKAGIHLGQATSSSHSSLPKTPKMWFHPPLYVRVLVLFCGLMSLRSPCCCCDVDGSTQEKYSGSDCGGHGSQNESGTSSGWNRIESVSGVLNTVWSEIWKAPNRGDIVFL